MLTDTVKVLVPAAASFLIGIALTPLLTHYLYTYKAWKKRAGKVALDGSLASEFNRLHEGNEVRAPRMGGIVIWASAIFTILGIAIIARYVPSAAALKLDFLSRNQTWIPLATLLMGAVAGLLDDLLTIQEQGKGLSLRIRLFIVVGFSAFIGYWFWDRLDTTALNLPGGYLWEVGWLIIPIFVLTTLALYASGVIDGIDGLAGGVFSTIFAAYAVIAFEQNQIDLAAFCAAIVGGLLAFLWFNIPPARFYMSETGSMGLTLTLATVAFMTDNLGGGIGVFVLPIIGLLLAATVASVLIQTQVWKRFFGRKLFRVTPLHHHFEAIGWPSYKVTMRYWILSILFAFIGVIIALTLR